MKIQLLTALGILSLLPVPTLSQTAAEDWYEQGVASLQKNQAIIATSAANAQARAKNIILFIGDGMGISTVTAARILAGQQQGHSGEENLLYFETFPYLALSKTYNTNQQTPDSAGTMSAMMTGIKTRAGVIAVSQQAARGDCSAVASNSVITALELAEIAGMSTGVVSTARLTNATPATTYAHSVEREHENDQQTGHLQQAELCTDIALQLIEFPKRFAQNYKHVDGLEVAMGGGRRNFLGKKSSTDPETGKSGKRLDNIDLTQQWLNQYAGASYVWNSDQLAAIDADKTKHLLGLFQPSHMRFESERTEDTAGEPSISEMTTKAIEILSRNKEGYFLMVEAGRIDHAHHKMDVENALKETIAFDQAIQTAHQLTNPEDTLIIVTADHSHTMTISGYPVRGNPILGHIHSKRSDMTIMESSKTLGYRTKITPIGAKETHAGEDVAIYATGPGAALVNGTLEQHVIYHVMNHAANLEERARQHGWPGRKTDNQQ